MTKNMPSPIPSLVPDTAPFAASPGVVTARPCDDDNGPGLHVQFGADNNERSAALYAVMSKLQQSGAQLRSITHAQQTLEDVFLRITNTNPQGGAA